MPPLFIIEHCQILKEIMAVYHSTLQEEEEDPVAESTSSPGSGSGGFDFNRVLDVMIDPAIEVIELTGQEKARVRNLSVGKSGGLAWDKWVFWVNGVGYLQVRVLYFRVGAVFSFAFIPVRIRRRL
jgi:conserved oligomeric Golgi complex subunit 6